MATNALEPGQFNNDKLLDTTKKPVSNPFANVKWDPNSIVDFLKSSGGDSSMASRAKLFETQGLGSAGTYKGTAAQNMALLAKMKGYQGGTTTGKFGSSSGVGMDKKNTTAMGAAGQSIVPTTTPNQPPVQTPTPTQVASDPQLTAFETQKNEAFTQIDNQYKPQEDMLHQNLASVVAGYQEDKKKAMAGAEAEYAKANPYGSGSDKEMFMKAISENYDTQIKQATMEFGSQMNQLTAAKQAAKNDVTTQYQTQVSEYRANQATQFKDFITGVKEGSQPSDAEIQEAMQMAVAAGKDPMMAFSEIMGAKKVYQGVQTKEEQAQARLDLAIASGNRAEEASARAELASAKALESKEGYGKATIVEQMGVQKFIASSPTVNINGKDVVLTSADWAAAKEDPDMFNFLFGEAIKAGAMSETTVAQ